MPQYPKDFTIAEDFFTLDPEQQELVWKTYLEQYRPETLNELRELIGSGAKQFLAVMRARKILGYIVYKKMGNKCRISMLWGRLSKDFVKAHGITPPYQNHPDSG